MQQVEMNTGYKDYYYILGVSPDATPAEITEAYQNLYEKHGPHINITGQDPEVMLKMFREITDAYDVLSDPAKRRQYDEATQIKERKGDLRSLWQKVAGQKDADQKRDANKLKDALDLPMEIDITLSEAFKGTEKVITINEPIPCQDCTGLKPVNRLQCPNCRGLGYKTTTRREELKLCPGLIDKQEIRYPQLGKFDLQVGKRGDLILILNLLPHDFFSVLDRDITCTLPVTALEAVLGLEVQVPTMKGKVLMNLKPLTQVGQVYRLRGMGLGGADQLVTIDIVVPKQISEKELELYKQLKDSNSQPNPRDEIFSKIKG